MKDNEIRIEIDASTAELTKKLTKLEGQLKSLDRSNFNNLTKQNDQLTRSFQQLATHVAKLATIYGGFHAIIGATESVAEFEQSITRLGVYTGATGEELDRLKEKALELGRSTAYSANQVAGALNSMGLAGLSVQEQLDGVGDVLNLASVGMIDIDDATRITVSIMKSFGLESTQMKEVTDVIAKGATLSATSITELGEAMGNVAPVSHSLGIDLYETTASLDVLADASIRGASGGTQLKMVMSRLASNTEAKKWIDKLGISMYDLRTGELLPLNEQLTLLKGAFSKLSTEEKNVFAGKIAGEEAKASLLTLMQYTDELTEKTKKLHLAVSDDFAKTSAEKMMDTLIGSYKEFKSAINGIALALGETLIPMIRETMDSWTDAINSMSKEEIDSLADSLIEFGSVLSTVTSAVGFLVGKLVDLATEFPHITSAVGGLYLASKALESDSLKPLLKTIDSVTNSTTVLTKKGIAPLIDKLKLFATMNLGLGAIATGFVLLGGAIYDMYQKAVISNEILEESSRSASKNYAEIADSVMSHYDKASQSIVMQADEKDKLIKVIDREIEATKKKLAVDEKYFESDETYNRTQSNLRATLEDLVYQKGVVTNATIKDVSETKKAVDSQTEYQKSIKLVADNIEKLERKYRNLESSAISALSSQKQTLSKLNGELEKLRNGSIRIDEKYYNDAESLELEYQKRIVEIKGDNKSKVNLINDEMRKAQKEFYDGNYDLAEKYYNDLLQFADDLKVGSISRNGDILRSEEDVKKEKIRLTQEAYTAKSAILEKERVEELKLNKDKIDMKMIEIDLVKEQIKMNSMYIESLKKGSKELSDNPIKFNDEQTTESLKRLDEMTNTLKQKLGDIDVEIKDAEAKGKLESIKNGNYDVSVGADTSIAEKEISSIPSKQGEMSIHFGANTEKIVTEMRLVKGKYESVPIDLPIGAETYWLEKKVYDMTGHIEGTTADMQVGADTTPTANSVNSIVAQIGNTTPMTQPLYIDFSDANMAFEQFIGYVSSTPIVVDLGANTSGAYNQVVGFVNAVNNMTATIDVYEVIHATRANGGSIPRFATGGHFTGSGRVQGYDPTDSDKVHALLTGGEFVIRRQAVDKVGTSLLHKINRGEKPEGYATGGVVKGYATGGVVENTSSAGSLSLAPITQNFSLYSNADDVADDFNELQYSIDSTTQSVDILSDHTSYLGTIVDGVFQPYSSGADDVVDSNVDIVESSKHVISMSRDVSNSYSSMARSADSYADAISRAGYYRDHPASVEVSKLVWESEHRNLFSTGGEVPRFATGGYFSGSGRVGGYDPTDSDKVLARLTGGEFVVKRQAVDKVGLDFLHKINNMGDINGYATGGYIGSSTQQGTQVSETVRLEFVLGGNTYEAFTERSVAQSLKAYNDRWGRE